jgi:putative nucleotidyltransferase with HDIG domain
MLYRGAGQPFTEKERQTLLENNVTRLLVDRFNRKAYQRYLESQLSFIVTDSSIKESIRAGIVYDSAKLLMEDLFARPEMGENIQRSKELVGSTVGFVLTGQTAFHSLLRVMSFDYSTYTHSVNVCTLSLALAQYTGLKNPRDLRALGTGALLHDIGKTKVDDRILNKREPLTPAEMDLIRKHPEWGYDIIRQTNLVDPESYYPILQHHERENATGYPEAIDGPEIHLFGKIVAIADVFDAMTTRRAYRAAIDSYPALKEMFADTGAFDAELLEKFTKMLGPLQGDD